MRGSIVCVEFDIVFDTWNLLKLFSDKIDLERLSPLMIVDIQSAIKEHY